MKLIDVLLLAAACLFACAMLALAVHVFVTIIAKLVGL